MTQTDFYSFTKLKWAKLKCVICLLFLLSFFKVSARDVGAPNIDLSKGTFEGWVMETGRYYRPGSIADGISTTYQWTGVVRDTSPRFHIANDINEDSEDLIIHCDNFYQNPFKDGAKTMRLGNYGYGKTRGAENDANEIDKSAAAERATYKFKVTKDSTALILNFACVLHDPEDAGTPHYGDQIPQFGLYVEFKSPTGANAVPSCGTFETIADKEASYLKRPTYPCQKSLYQVDRHNNPYLPGYVYMPWTSSVYDLTGMVGYEVTICFYNHDCLRGTGNSEGPGGHESYGYFYVESIEKKLEIRNCADSGENPTIRAPKGFASYRWLVNGEESSIFSYPDPEDKSYVEVQRSQMRSNYVYKVEMRGGSESCSPVVLETKLIPVKVKPNFEAKVGCGGIVNFTNTSTIDTDEDQLFRYNWDLGDGDIENEENVSHRYDLHGEYDVKLTAETKNGCSNDTIIKVNVPHYPKVIIDGDRKQCQGVSVPLRAKNLTERTTVTWLNSKKQEISTERAINVNDINSSYYYITAKDEIGCVYDDSIFVTRLEVPSIYFKVMPKDTVCSGDTVSLYVSSDVTDCDFKWFDTSKESELSVIPTVTQSYSCTVIKDICSTTDSVKIYVNPSPIVGIQAPSKVCAGETAKLTGTGAEQYYWDTGVDSQTGQMVKPNGPSLDITLISDTTINVLGIDKYGCIGNSSKRVQVKPGPKIVIADSLTRVCPNHKAAYVNLATPEGHTFEWHDGSTESYYRKVLSEDTVWNVKVTRNGCTDSLEIPVYISNVPDFYIIAQREICAFDTLGLSLGGEFDQIENIEWVYPASGDAKTTWDVPSGPTSYQVIATSKSGCPLKDTFRVKVNIPIQVIATAPQSVCIGQYAKLVAQGNIVSQSWYADGSYFDYEKETEFLVRKPVWLKVESVDANECKSKDSVFVDTLPQPLIEIVGQLDVCPGGVAKVDATCALEGRIDYVWHDGVTGAHREFPVTANRQEITVEGTRFGCTSKVSGFLTILQVPDLWVDGDSLICPGKETSLVAHGGAETYSWGLGLSGETLKVSPSIQTSYNLKGVFSNGCETEKTVTVRMRTLPDVKIEGERYVCKDSLVTLTASGALEYIWSTGQPGESIAESVVRETDFVVTGRDEFGCESTVSYTVLPVEHPSLAYFGRVSECEGEYVHLRADNASATKFEWHYGDNVVYEDKLDFIPERDMYVRLVGTRMNCSSDSNIYIHPLSLPNVLVTGSDIVCPGDPATITASGAVSYVWSTNETSPTITYNPMLTTTFYVTGKDENNCKKTVPYELKVYDIPKLEIKLSAAEGCADEGDRVKLTASGGRFYEWSAEPEPEGLSAHYNSETMEISILEDTKFTLLGRDEHGCESTTYKSVTLSNRRTFDFTVTPRWIDENNPTVQFSGVSPVEAQWSWRPYSTAQELEGRTMNYRYDTEKVGDSVSVIARAVDGNGCIYEGVTSLYVWKEIWAPEAFTPNGDEKNDGFRFYGGRYVDEFSYIIYNRLGEIMYEGRGLDDTWDGKWNGKECPWGVYGWVYNYKCKFGELERSGENRGFVTLVR